MFGYGIPEEFAFRPIYSSAIAGLPRRVHLAEHQHHLSRKCHSGHALHLRSRLLLPRNALVLQILLFQMALNNFFRTTIYGNTRGWTSEVFPEFASIFLRSKVL